MAHLGAQAYVYENALEEALAASGLAEGKGARSLAAWMTAQSVERGEPLPLDGDYDDLEGLRNLYKEFLRGAFEREGSPLWEGLERLLREGSPQEAASFLREYRGGLLPPDLEPLVWRGEGGGTYVALFREGRASSVDLLLRYEGGRLEILEGERRREAVAPLLASGEGEAVLLRLQDDLAAFLEGTPGEDEVRRGARLLLKGVAESARRMAEAISQDDPLGELALTHTLPQEHLLVIDGLAQRREELLRAVAETAQALAERGEAEGPLAQALARWAASRGPAPARGAAEPEA